MTRPVHTLAAGMTALFTSLGLPGVRGPRCAATQTCGSTPPHMEDTSAACLAPLRLSPAPAPHLQRRGRLWRCLQGDVARDTSGAFWAVALCFLRDNVSLLLASSGRAQRQHQVRGGCMLGQDPTPSIPLPSLHFTSLRFTRFTCTTSFPQAVKVVGELKLAQEQAGAEAQLLSSPILLNLRQVLWGRQRGFAAPCAAW